jgi:predicted ribosome-associated RNA-binding protein Tma20
VSHLCDVADVKTTCSHISSYKDRCLASLEALKSIFALSLCLVTVDRGSREALYSRATVLAAAVVASVDVSSEQRTRFACSSNRCTMNISRRKHHAVSSMHVSSIGSTALETHRAGDRACSYS